MSTCSTYGINIRAPDKRTFVLPLVCVIVSRPLTITQPTFLVKWPVMIGLLTACYKRHLYCSYVVCHQRTSCSHRERTGREHHRTREGNLGLLLFPIQLIVLCNLYLGVGLIFIKMRRIFCQKQRETNSLMCEARYKHLISLLVILTSARYCCIFLDEDRNRRKTIPSWIRLCPSDRNAVRHAWLCRRPY